MVIYSSLNSSLLFLTLDWGHWIIVWKYFCLVHWKPFPIYNFWYMLSYFLVSPHATNQTQVYILIFSHSLPQIYLCIWFFGLYFHFGSYVFKNLILCFKPYLCMLLSKIFLFKWLTIYHVIITISLLTSWSHLFTSDEYGMMFCEHSIETCIKWSCCKQYQKMLLFTYFNIFAKPQ